MDELETYKISLSARPYVRLHSDILYSEYITVPQNTLFSFTIRFIE